MTIGACRFCGQVVTIGEGINLSEEQANEQATLRCSCPEAERYQDRRNELSRARQRINELFGPLCIQEGLEPLPKEQIAVLEAAAQAKVEEVILSASFNFGDGVSGKITRNSKGQIEIVRTDKVQNKGTA